jgi:hypothetical protein
LDLESAARGAQVLVVGRTATWQCLFHRCLRMLETKPIIAHYYELVARAKYQ